jgi:hypothetical protein
MCRSVFHFRDAMRIAMASMGWSLLTAMYERARHVFDFRRGGVPG